MTLKDNSVLTEEEKVMYSSAIDFLKNKKLIELRKENSNLIIYPTELGPKTKDKVIFEEVFDGKQLQIRTGNLIGLIKHEDGRGNTTIINIGSRFDEGQSQSFLTFMLSKVFSGNLFKGEIPSDTNGIWDLLLLFIYQNQIETAFSRGLYKRYAEKKEVGSIFKGKWDINQQIKSGLPIYNKLATISRRYTFDNEILHLVRHAHLRLMNKYRAIWAHCLYSKPILRDAITQIEHATPTFNIKERPLGNYTYHNSLRHHYYKDYEMLRKTCLQILRNEGVNPYSAGAQSIQGVLFDISWLWECYVFSLLSRLSDVNFRHIDNDDGQSFGNQVFEQSDYEFYPDFIDENTKWVFDAKYKNWELNRQDVQQVLTYMYMSGGKFGGVIYPTNNKTKQFKPRPIKTPLIESYFLEIPFFIPNSTNKESYLNAENNWLDDIQTRLREIN